MILRGGPNIYGVPIGVLCTEAYHAKVPGHIKNASTFDFPVSYKVVKGVTPEKIINKGDMSLLEPLIEAARDLEEEGVLAITGSCGFMVLYQGQLADAVSIPVFMSGLIQVPMVHRMLRADQKVGLMVARKDTLTQEHLRIVGAENVPVCIAGMDNTKEVREVIIEGKRRELDLDKLEEEVVSAAVNLARENPDMGAIVMEGTDFPPFSHIIQQKLNLPVFDIITLTNMVYQAVVRKGYDGIMPH